MRRRLASAAPPAVRRRLASAPPPDAADTERIRTRARLMIEITARAGSYRNGLLAAVNRLTPEEAGILADLERHELDIPRLRDVLWGAHVLVDDPALYERWAAAKASRKRISSHHPDVDKKRYPDIGLKGPLVREKLHGRTAHGTWIQLEKTPAAVGAGRLPSWQDVQHLYDYVVYRITRRNVGPWGLSGITEKRPMYLSPDLGATTPLPERASPGLTRALERVEADDDVTSVSPDLARHFPPPERANDLRELTFAPTPGEGRGLFGASDVWITETPSPAARELLGHDQRPAEWSLPAAGEVRRATLRLGDRRELTYAVRLPASQEHA
jgi:hypothetical protein